MENTELNPGFIDVLKKQLRMISNGWLRASKRRVKGFGLDKLEATYPLLTASEQSILTPIINELKAGMAKKSAVEKASGSTLATILFEQTHILKTEYFLKTADYCTDFFALCQERAAWSYEQWIKAFPVPMGAKVTLSKQGGRVHDQVRLVMRQGFEAFKAREMKLAEQHYQDSILKLAVRLEQKGISNSDEFEITTARVGVNIETIIKHKDGQITRAFTIIASGPVQRPHYRYLIK